MLYHFLQIMHTMCEVHSGITLKLPTGGFVLPFSSCQTPLVIFTFQQLPSKEGYFGFAIVQSDTARENFQKQLVDRFNVELQGRMRWYLSARIHQYQSRYTKSILARFLEAAGRYQEDQHATYQHYSNQLYSNLQGPYHNAC
jgi:hypothetical protein